MDVEKLIQKIEELRNKLKTNIEPHYYNGFQCACRRIIKIIREIEMEKWLNFYVGKDTAARLEIENGEYIHRNVDICRIEDLDD